MGASAARKLAAEEFRFALLSSSGKREAIGIELGGIGVTGSNQSSSDLARLVAQMASALAEALGKPVAYNAVTPAQYRGVGFQGADDLGNRFQFNTEFAADFCRVRDLATARALNPQLQTFRQWLQAKKGSIPLTWL